MRWLGWILGIALGLLGGQRGYAKESYFLDIQELGSSFGLESLVIRQISQDRAGFIWLSTMNGLARFDGYTFRYIRNPLLEVKVNMGLDIIGDSDGWLWVCNSEVRYDFQREVKSREIFQLDIFSEKLIPFKEGAGANAPFEDAEVSAIRADRSYIYVGLIDGRVFRYRAGIWHCIFSDPNKLPVLDILPGQPGGYWWMIRGNSLCQISSAGQILERDYVDLDLGDHWSLELDPWYRVILNIRESWTKKSIFLKEPGEPLRSYDEKFGVDLSVGSELFFDKQLRMWLYQEDKFIIYEPEGKRVAVLYGRGSFAGRPQYLVDRGGQVWISFGDRFISAEIRKPKFTSYLDQSFISIRGLLELPNRDILALTNTGVYSVSRSEATPKLVMNETGGFGMARDAKSIWIGVHGAHIWRLDVATLQVVEKWPISKGLGPIRAKIHALVPFLDSKGRLWVGTNYGLLQADWKKKELYPFSWKKKDVLGNLEITAFFENEEGIWLGTSQGLFLFNPDIGRLTHIEALPNYYISALYQGSDGVFWLGTRVNGLLRWERSSKKYTYFNKEKGFPNDNIHGILEDSLHFLWISSNYGLIRFNPANSLFQVFFHQDGISNNEFNRQSFCKTTDGALFFGGISGVNELNPSDFRIRQRHISQIKVTDYDEWDLKTGRMVNQNAKFYARNQIVLPYYNRSFQIQFSLLDFGKIKENIYAYRLDGIDADWINIRENYLRFTGLPYGKYKLRIRGATPEEGWVSNELVIPVIVEWPFYRMPWFIAGSTGLLISVLSIFIRWRVRTIERTKQRLEWEVAARTRELELDKQTIAAQKDALASLNQTKDHLLAVVGHELRGPMLSIQNIGENISYLLESGKFVQAASLGKQVKQRVFSVRMLLDNLLYWGLHHAGKGETIIEPVSIPDLMVETIELIDFWVISKEQQLKINYPEPLMLQSDRSMLRIILLNLLTNAIKFTPKGGTIQLTARVDEPNQLVYLSVRDMGKGIEAAQIDAIFAGELRSTSGTEGEKGTGMGLSLCQKLLLLMGGVLRIQGIPGVGSIFEIGVPMNGNQKGEGHG